MPVNAVIIVAAGRGERMGDNISAGPKQYRSLGRNSVLQETIGKFAAHPDVDQVQVVIHRDDAALYQESVHPHPKLLEPVTGGPSRQQSCRLGLEALASKINVSKVLIHDAARPFVSSETISAVLDAIESGKCALPCHPIVESVKRVSPQGLVEKTVDRDGLFIAQTPQGFRYSEISAAHQHARDNNIDNLPDDAAVAEFSGMKVEAVEVSRDNMKITTKDDLELARSKLSAENNVLYSDVRTGNGYDIHRLGPGDAVILCGVQIPHTGKLLGHSDADVGLHALTDAILATIGAGDIGSHFPPTDPKWKGAASEQFLAHALKLVDDRGGRLNHLDVTLICELPKIGPHREAMRARIAAICDLDVSRISVKATTNEAIGAVGRHEGIAALATATVLFS